MRWMCLALFACDGGNNAPSDHSGDGDPITSSPGVCVSAEEWTGGDRESPLMHPGMDCIECHTARREGPAFTLAGTVFTNLHEPDDCNGRDHVTVEITDAEGVVFEADTNAAGNFYLSVAGLVMPYKARILVNGDETSAMASAQTDGACASCHTQHGKHDAPGRIVAGD